MKSRLPQSSAAQYSFGQDPDFRKLLEKATDISLAAAWLIHLKKPVVENRHLACEDDRIDTAKELMKKAEAKGVCIHLPSDSIIADKFAEDASISSS
jgi:phosphoglycerate kinase